MSYTIQIQMYVSDHVYTVADIVARQMLLRGFVLPQYKLSTTEDARFVYVADPIWVEQLHRSNKQTRIKIELSAETHAELGMHMDRLSWVVPQLAKPEWVYYAAVFAQYEGVCPSCASEGNYVIVSVNAPLDKRPMDIRTWHESIVDSEVDEVLEHIDSYPHSLMTVSQQLAHLLSGGGPIWTRLPITNPMCSDCLVLNEGTEEEQYWMGIRESDEEEADLLAGRNPYDETHDNEYHAARRRQMLDDLRNGRGL